MHRAAERGIRRRARAGAGSRRRRRRAQVKPFSPSTRRSCAAPTRSERTSGNPHAAASLTTTAQGSRSERSEDVGSDVELDELLPLGVSGEHGTHAELGDEPFEPSPIRAVSRQHEQKLPDRRHRPPREREPRDPSPERAARPRARRRRRVPERARVPQPGRREVSSSTCSPNASTSIVLANRRTCSAASTSRDHRVARERPCDEHGRCVLHNRCGPRFLDLSAARAGPFVVTLHHEHVWHSFDPAPGDRSLRRKGAQPETTATEGRASVSAPTMPGVSG